MEYLGGGSAADLVCEMEYIHVDGTLLTELARTWPIR